jgi:hypothetical protein
MKPKTRHRFDYSALDRLLKESHFPEEVGNQLDETLNDLVHYSGVADDYCSELPNRYYLLRELRDIFWKLSEKKK